MDGFDPDRLLREISDVTRSGKLPDGLPDSAGAALVHVAQRVNQLADWIGMGGRLPGNWARGQRLGPYAGPWRQRLVSREDGLLHCASCDATIEDGIMTHSYSCGELP